MIVACTDGSEYGDKAVKFAAQFAEKFGVDLALLHVVPESGAYREVPAVFEPKKKEAEAILSRAKNVVEEVTKDINCYEKIGWGQVYHEILRISEAEGFDGIVIGTRGLGGLKRMSLGSVADRVVRYANCQVKVVR